MKPSTIPHDTQALIAKLRINDELGPAAIETHLEQLGKLTTKGKKIKQLHIKTLIYGSTSKRNGVSDPLATDAPRSGGGSSPPPPVILEATVSGDAGDGGTRVELLTVDDRLALPGLTDSKGVPIRPQGARVELYKSAKVVVTLALKDYRAARDRKFDKCGECGATDEKLLRRLAAGIHMADGLLVSAETAEERGVRVQLTQLNFHSHQPADPKGDLDTPGAATEPLLNIDIVRLLEAFLGDRDIEITDFFSYCRVAGDTTA